MTEGALNICTVHTVATIIQQGGGGAGALHCRLLRPLLRPRFTFHLRGRSLLSLSKPSHTNQILAAGASPLRLGSDEILWTMTFGSTLSR